MNYQESREYIDRVTREIPSVLGLGDDETSWKSPG